MMHNVHAKHMGSLKRTHLASLEISWPHTETCAQILKILGMCQTEPTSLDNHSRSATKVSCFLSLLGPPSLSAGSSESRAWGSRAIGESGSPECNLAWRWPTSRSPTPGPFQSFLWIWVNEKDASRSVDPNRMLVLALFALFTFSKLISLTVKCEQCGRDKLL